MQYFKDEWYYRAKNYVHNTITEQEYKLYKAGKIRKLYDSFEYLLLDNLKYYNRIIRTIIWLYENELIDKYENWEQKLDTREKELDKREVELNIREQKLEQQEAE